MVSQIALGVALITLPMLGWFRITTPNWRTAFGHWVLYLGILGMIAMTVTGCVLLLEAIT
jgi:hypothetical protein